MNMPFMVIKRDDAILNVNDGFYQLNSIELEINDKKFMCQKVISQKE